MNTTGITLSLGWGTGGPAWLRRSWEDEAAAERDRDTGRTSYPPVSEVRERTVEQYARTYVGPLNPLCGGAGGVLVSENGDYIFSPGLRQKAANPERFSVGGAAQ